MPLPDTPDLAVAALKEREGLKAGEAAELAWWKPARLEYSKCTFEGLIVAAQARVPIVDPVDERSFHRPP
jgi:hypothetical protein